ncbi:hypothetical protein [Leptolyngbya iicbica]|uniref:Uncharacterized protein n=2 Tax=Cyanophyceae TaxID=3028117 RepID=A0A4Q7E5K1_9CYAN|nr:hypothetical protein [Leptolyngbya sp. LK]RZM77230.1 hypothetical protein DYY88_16415 [Leptolyngbya sp. LK]
MLASIKLPQLCLAGLTLGCLGAVSFSPTFSAPRAESDPRSPESHRGSGRVVSQVPTQWPPDATYDYRGTGRIHQTPEELLAHRGSGRSPAVTEPDTAYRGSGRVMPYPANGAEWA